MDTTILRRWVELTTRKRRAKEQISEIDAELAVLEEQIKEEFSSAAIRRINVDGQTVYLQREVYVSVRNGDHDRAARILREHGLDEYVAEKVSTQGLRAWVREQEALDEPIPEDLAETLAISELYRLRMKKG